MLQGALISGSLPLLAVLYGVSYGAHDYRVYKKTIFLKDLPKSLDGLRVLQISDIHVGSFMSPRAVDRGIGLLNAQKADVVLFTGDLVNSFHSEMRSYGSIFSKIKAPMGVYSILGNHDYGTYANFSSQADERKNFREICALHQHMGWRLLRNEHVLLRSGQDELALIGVENWSKYARFARYGDIAKASEGIETPCRILLSHDPSHWRGEVLNSHKQIGLTLSGHTHGFQMGVKVGDWQWSPAQYFYDEWAGLYEKGGQKLYVNRGFGYIGFPGRMGVPPEITLLELRSPTLHMEA